LLDTLAKNKQTNIALEFHNNYINPYDAKLVNRGNYYICESIFYRCKETNIWFPPFIFRAMVSNPNPAIIYIKVIL
jgi:hypothetical protein